MFSFLQTTITIVTIYVYDIVGRTNGRLYLFAFITQNDINLNNSKIIANVWTGKALENFRFQNELHIIRPKPETIFPLFAAVDDFVRKTLLGNNSLAKDLKDIFRNTFIICYLLRFFQQCLILVKIDSWKGRTESRVNVIPDFNESCDD